jgi:hypothetical protein
MPILAMNAPLLTTINDILAERSFYHADIIISRCSDKFRLRVYLIRENGKTALLDIVEILFHSSAAIDTQEINLALA